MAKEGSDRRGKQPAGGKASKKRIESVLSGLNASRATVVLNPASGAGAGRRISDELQKTLKDLGLGFDFKLTEGPGHAKEIAREAGENGYGTVIAVGGDGTVFEVINGMMAVEEEDRPVLGIIPAGPSCDMCLTLGIPQDWITASTFLVSGRKRSMDVGRIEYVSDEGPRTGYFANVAVLGFEGEVAERANGLPGTIKKAVGPTAAHLASLVVSFSAFTEKDIELVVDGEPHRVLATSVAVANCKFFGAKMCIAPEAECDDGLLDVVVIGAGFGRPSVEGEPADRERRHSLIEKGTARLKMARYLPRVYRGTHLDDESVMVFRGKRIEVSSDDRLLLEADGQVVGRGPFAAQVINDAIQVVA